MRPKTHTPTGRAVRAFRANMIGVGCGALIVIVLHAIAALTK